jgi:branched-chain amino acid transport system substrate-binding protein
LRISLKLGPLLAALGAAACATAPVAEGPRTPAEAPPVERPAEARREAPIRVGVVVSSTGSPVLQQYGEMVLEGARLAAERQSTPRRAVELVIRDDGGTAGGAAAAVRELEQAGVAAIVGPLVDEAVTAAARGRSSERTLIISPTAVGAMAPARNVIALNVVDTRGAAALGEYARRYARVGVLYGRSPDMSAQARAFMDAYSRGGHGSVREEGYDPGATTVATQLRRLRDAQVEAIFLPASERQLQLVLTQVEYAGLGSAQLLGNEAWLSDAARGAPQRVLEGAIIATSLWRESPDVAWREFVDLYEARHRRTLDTPIPALGYDATTLAVRAVTGGGAAVQDFRGATGVLWLQNDAVTRRPFLVRLQGGRLIPVN